MQKTFIHCGKNNNFIPYTPKIGYTRHLPCYLLLFLLKSHLAGFFSSTKLVNISLAAKGALAHRLQRCNAFKIQYGRQGAPKWPAGSGKVFGCSCQLLPNRFFNPRTPFRRKVDNGGKREKTRLSGQ